MAEQTLTSALQHAARSAAGVRFLQRDEREEMLSYENILGRARGVAGGLVHLGARPGDRVALVLPTAPGFFDGFFGTLLAGAIPVPLYPPVRLGKLEEYHRRTAGMLRACEARLVLTDRRASRLLGISVERAQPPLGCVCVEDVPHRELSLPSPVPDDVAFIQFSSGTTVEPKPVRLTHAQVLANVDAILAELLRAYPEGPDLVHKCVSWLPLYHDMGLVGCVLTALRHSAELTLIPPEAFVTRPALWLRAISRYRATITTAPNFAYGLCTERISDAELDGVDLSCLRVALNGAEPVTATVLERFVQRFEPFGLRPRALTPVYGLAEAALAVTFSDLKEPFRSLRFDRRSLSERGRAVASPAGVPLVDLGRPLPGYDLRVRSAAGADLGTGELGDVWVRGPSVMQGYHGQPEATRRAVVDGWLATGDTGFVHEGHLFLYGRGKDVIIIRGRNYAAQDVEQALVGVDGVRTGCSAAFGVVAEGGDGETLVVLAEHSRGPRTDDRTRDHGPLVDRISRRVTEQTGLVPARVLVLAPGTLPRTSSGKIRRGVARQQYLSGRLARPGIVTPLRMLAAVARSALSMRLARRRAAAAGRQDMPQTQSSS